VIPLAKVRISRVAEEIKKELSYMLQMGLKDPRVGFVTITGVEVTNDYSQAKVYVSIFGDEEKRQDSLKALSSAAGYLRTELGKKIRIRHIPELLFKIDSSIDYGRKIEKILSEINEEKK
jgi:ribosome-binding factor A